MSNLSSFMGGLRIRPNAFERLASSRPIEVFSDPDTVEIEFSEKNTLAVEIGELVRVGTPLCTPGDALPIHSSVSGKVTDVIRGEDSNAFRVIIENDKKGDPDPSVIPFSKKLTETAPDEIVSIIKRAGICESGDGLSVARRIECALGGARRLMINCTECEPFLASRRRLVLEKPSEVLGGAKILLRALEVSYADIVIDNGNVEAIRSLETAVGTNPLLRIRVTDAKYPQGDKRLIVNAVAGKETPVREATAQLGYVVFTAETCADIFRAFAYGMPQTRRLITVGGDCISEQKVLDVPIGTPLAEIAKQCGGAAEDTERIVCGGLMSGKAIPDVSYCITKRDSAFLFLSREYVKPKTDSACIRCGKCVENCPMHLMPLYLARQAKKGNITKALAMGLKSCIECGTCTYNCPGGVEHVYYIRLAKNTYNSERAKEEENE